METEDISSLKEYIEFVDKLPRDFSLSRGQKNIDWSLLPSGLRLGKDGSLKYGPRTVDNFIDKFKKESRVYLSSKDILNIKNKLEWVVNARHFDVPTTLLDFSFSPLTALMFAVEDGFDDDCKDSVIWFLDPKKLNGLSGMPGRGPSVNISSEEFDENKLLNCVYPVCVESDMINNRIFSQNGCFVYFRPVFKPIPLDEMEKVDDFMKKVIINSKNKRKILISLYKIGYRFKNIYPELDSIAKDYRLEEDIKLACEGDDSNE